MSKRDWIARSVADPEPGYFQMRLVRGGVFVAARIRLQDGLWQAVIDGSAYPAAEDPAAAPGVFRIWHGGEAITEAEYRRMLRTKAALIEADPSHPAATPTKPINLEAMPSIF